MNQIQNKIGGVIVEAIAPGLIMLLIASLIYFLVDVFYFGPHLARMFWVLGFWIFGVVLVCRIAITEDHDRSLLSGIPLAVVTMIALQRFVQMNGPLAPFSFFFNLSFVLFSWWCASRLVWDCTLVDSSRDTTSKGLLQRIPWPRSSSSAESTTDEVTESSSQTTESPEIFGATSEEEPIAPRPDFWKRIVNMGRKPNTPGLTIVYFSLAAIPIFGLGQSFIAVDDTASRIFSIKMFVLFSISALCLLLVTSLLGLNQYLLKRGVTMPNPVAASWLVTGVAVVIAVLTLAWMIPRPWPEYSLGTSPVSFETRDDLESSRHGLGNDGPEEENSTKVNQERESTGDQTRSEGKEKSKTGQDDSKSKQETSGGKSEGKSQGNDSDSKSQDKTQGDKKESDGNKDGDQKSKSENKQDDPGNKSDSEKQNENKSDSNEEHSSKEESNNQSRDDKRDQKNEDRPQEEKSDQAKADESKESQSRDKSKPSSRLKFNFSLGAALTIVKWLLYFACFLIAAYFAWVYRERIKESWKNFLAELKEFWERFFGQSHQQTPTQKASTDVIAKQIGFSDFDNPFQSGRARKMSREELVKYCFAALEGWANDNHASRKDDQTPHEFAEQIGQKKSGLRRGSMLLAELYCQAVYSQSKLPVGTRQRLEQFWSLLESSRIEQRPKEIDLLTGLPAQN